MTRFRLERALDFRSNLVLDIDDVILRAEMDSAIPVDCNYGPERVHTLPDGCRIVLSSSVVASLIVLSRTFRLHLLSNGTAQRVEHVRNLLNNLSNDPGLIELLDSFSSCHRFRELKNTGQGAPRSKSLLSLFPEVPGNCMILDDKPQAWELSQVHLVILIKNIPKNKAWNVDFENPRLGKLLEHLHQQCHEHGRSFEISLKYQTCERDIL
ncbi:hypothetical protein BDR26DRAFT_855219, partial [Obelidium mucronatum]